ncbi:tRNA pseudouridine(38-40) synthase TruA [Gracilimonas mengyeensis]|uniref:tRNA pseudouridine synthase A n=1 Tax=Gracilimonas mengyeensis TaxID=1302730 RepID=A0A521D475_9BACT|nr:tRNA pseudouridine(38-40) synthase TruA [Gracilimonas mengyeensis]SMO66503.1 tRNA pseudouridine38-40 synthase [Gracilimonas mengyeensis]
MPRYKLTIEYDGTDFSGWQIQPNAITIEESLEEAFSTVLQQPVDLIGQGRTDAGVHARGQVAHVDLPEQADLEKLLSAVNRMAGDHIQIIDHQKVHADFHARFDAIARQYEYTLTTRSMPLMHRYTWPLRQPVELEKLHECAELLLGEHDFAGFSKYNEDNRTTLCTIQKSEFEIDGEVLKYHIRANRFLRNMVRRLIGTMVYVGQGKISKKTFRQILEKTAFKAPTYTAPARGLVLQEIFYKKVKKTLESS